jgi:cellulose synthase/poly-beta-1,6-N-acetylglucosamine synthase-like glycosyltransferase
VIVVYARGQTPSFLSSLKNQHLKGVYEIIEVEGGNRSQAKNSGIFHAASSLVAFTDSDCDPPEDWLARLVESLPEHESVAGVGGVSLGMASSSSLQKAIDGVFSTYLGSLGSPSLSSFPENQKRFARAISGHNCIFRKDALLEVEGFDERFELNEDTDICARLAKRGYALLLDKSSFVFHSRRRSLGSFVKQFFWYGIGRMRSMLTSARYVDIRILALFLLALGCGLTAILNWQLAAVALSAYVFLVLLSSLEGAIRVSSIRLMPMLVLLFVLEHFAYLLGLFSGLFMGPWKKNKEYGPIKIRKHVVGAK